MKISINWDEWRGSLDGRPTMFIKTLLKIHNNRIDLHKFVRNDDPDCFHTHPAYAIRIIIKGGYIEEMESGTLKAWRFGDIGLIKPETSHRILGLLNNKPAYTIWLRFKKTSQITLNGKGWYQ